MRHREYTKPNACVIDKWKQHLIGKCFEIDLFKFQSIAFETQWKNERK